MSGESAPEYRLVRCPKCRLLLQENPDFDVYRCGGCGTTLQAKKRRNGAVNSDSSTQKTAAAPRNALDPVSDDKQNSQEEQLVIPQENGLRVKATNSSSGECSSDGNNERGQIENGECNGEQAVLPQENGVKEKAIRSSLGECSSDGNDGRAQIENGECNGEKSVLPQENDLREKETSSSLGECSLDGNDGSGQIENGERNGEQLVFPQENGLREKATRSSPGECSLDGNDASGQIENGECNGQQAVLPQENNLREKAKCSLDGNDGRGQIENVECKEEQLVLPQENGLREHATSSSSGEFSLDGSGRDQIENDEGKGEQLGPSSLSDEELEKEMDIYKLSDTRRHRVSNKGGSNEVDNSEIKASSELMEENSVENANDPKLELAREELSNENMPLEGAEEELICTLDKEDVNNEKSALVGVKSEVDITGGDLEGAGELNNENLLLQGAGQELISGSDGEDANDDKSALVGADPEVDISGSNKAEADKALNISAPDGEDPKSDQSALVGAKSEVDITGSASTAERSSTENFVSEKGNIAHCKLEEGTYDNVSSPDKQQNQAQEKVHHSFDCVRSADIFDASEVINPSSELSGTLGELSKSPTARSSHHAYDGSVSSNDGVYERFHSLDSFENTYTTANGVPEGSSRKGKGLVDSMLYGDLETQHQSYLPGAKHHALKDRRGNQNQVLETARHVRPHWTRTKGDEFPSELPFPRSGYQSEYESGSPSHQTHDELYCSSSFLSPDSCEDPDQEKMKLMRIVYKLQDQLNRTRYISGETNGRASTDVSFKGKHISTYHSRDLHERFYHGLDYPRCDGRCSHGINWHQRHNFSRPYLAETTCSTHLVDHPCFHCCPQEWQCSAELPPHVFYQHEELCRYHPVHSCCSSHHSLPSSPQWRMTSKLPAYDHETRSADQRHRVPEMKNYSREKQNLNKRHYRPVVGGAPFVTCHKCFKLLQVPADFLLFKRVYHQLKCGACSEVLKFSLQNRSHIVSYAPNAIGPPSSDLDDQNEMMNRSHIVSYAPNAIGPPSSEIDDQNEMIIGSDLHSASHADPVSYSDDYGHSVSKSYSSEGDPVSLTPLHPSHGNEYDKPSVSHSTFEPITEEKIASRSPSTSETATKTDELALHSSNMSGSEKLSSEIEARSQPKSSPLHQLMGYSSPSQVIRGVKSSVEGKETTLKGENDHSSQKD